MTFEFKRFQLRCRRAAAILLATVLQTGAFLLLGAGLAAAGQNCADPASVVEIAPGAFVRQGATALPAPENRGAIANIGFIIGGYWGGLLTGLFLAILSFSSIGKMLALKAGKRIDKHMKDFIVQTQLEKNED